MTEQLRVAFRTLGCKVNRVESEDMAADLLGRGVLLASEDQADVVVVNTCTVTGEADAKARKAVRQALASPASPVVVVTGCLAAVDPAALESLGDRVVVEADKARVAGRVAEALGIDADAGHGQIVRAGEWFRTRAMLKIEDGCDVFCSYCIVPHARGNPHSVPLAVVVKTATDLVEAGAREIVLTGINLGRYRDEAYDLADVVQAVAQTGVQRLRLSSIEPPDLTPRLLETLGSIPAFCRHLHVPLQSGSDPVLSAMRRAYGVADYRRTIESAHEALPCVSLTTDVMVGFPGEDDSDAARTRSICEEIGFSKLHVFRYSARPGTPAAEMPQVDPTVKAERARLLRQVGDALRGRFLDAQVGRRSELLVERELNGSFEGTTRDYVRVRVSPSVAGVPLALTTGDVVEVVLGEREASGDVLTAVLAPREVR